MPKANETSRVVIFAPGAFSWTNKGDAALILSFLPWVEAEFDADEVVLTSFTPSQDSEYFDRRVLEMVTRPMRPIHRIFGRIGSVFPPTKGVLTRLRFFYFSCVMRLIPVWAKIYRRNRRIASFLAPRHVSTAADAVSESKLVIAVPGGYLNALRASNDWWLFHIPTFALAKALNKKLVLGPCSIGPFDSRHKTWARRTLAMADAIMVREHWSHEECLRLGYPRSKLFEAPDMAFWFASKPLSSETSPKIAGIIAGLENHEIVGVSVRTHNFPGFATPTDQQKLYLVEVANALGLLQTTFDARILIIPQTMEDISPGEDLAAILLANGVEFDNVQSDLSPVELHELYGRLRLLVGTRMHANILAMSAGTPVAAISYEPKTLGILDSMGLADWGIEITQLSDERLAHLVERQWRAAPHLAEVARIQSAEQGARIKEVWAQVAHLI